MKSRIYADGRGAVVQEDMTGVHGVRLQELIEELKIQAETTVETNTAAEVGGGNIRDFQGAPHLNNDL